MSKQLQNEPEYSYATHAVEANSVPQQSSGGDDDGHYGITEGVAVVDNTALLCRRRCTGEWSVFQKMI